MTNQVQVFENKYLAQMQQLQQLVSQKKELEKIEKDIKKELEEAMNKYNIKSIDNEFLKITRVEASELVSIDLTAMKKKEPDLYDDLLKDYPKVTKRNAYVRFTVK